MPHSLALTAGFFVLLINIASAQPTSPPLRVAIVGLVHGHVQGFFQQNLQRTDIEIVGISDPSRPLFAKYAKLFNLDPRLYYGSLTDMLEKTHPQAVLVYTSTYDHRAVVETCARYAVHVMMEKPLAVSYADALAIADAARRGNIYVLVNYETTWYRSNHAVYKLAQRHALGDIRKIVVHDGHRVLHRPRPVDDDPERERKFVCLSRMVDRPGPQWGRSAHRFRLLRSRPEHLVDAGASANLCVRRNPTHQARGVSQGGG